MLLAADRSIVLSPPITLAHPRSWQALPLIPEQRYETMHLLGGGSLLLWLMGAAHCLPNP